MRREALALACLAAMTGIFSVLERTCSYVVYLLVGGSPEGWGAHVEEGERDNRSYYIPSTPAQHHIEAQEAS